MLSKTRSIGLVGLRGYEVDIEIDINHGMPTFEIVGLADTTVKEAKERVKSAIKNSGFRFCSEKITANFAPADLKKAGTLYDLPLAVGVLRATGQLKCQSLDDTIIVGELSLDGNIRRINGLLPILITARDKGYKKIIIPKANEREASYIEGIEAFAFASLMDLTSFLRGLTECQPVAIKNLTDSLTTQIFSADFKYVKGQYAAKRALEIAASGGHNVIMVGPPGAGKTMLARCMPSILPQMSIVEALETTKIHSVAGVLNDEEGIVLSRPFRTPHHTSSRIALTGGGSTVKPGEISLAHNGILFMDELPEYPRSTLEILRQPLEDKSVTIARAAQTIEYPANFMLIGSMNPCPCGNYGSQTEACKCSPSQIAKYMSRISGPLLDRIDIHLEVCGVTYDDLATSELAEDSASIKQRVSRARDMQLQRFAGTSVYSNSGMTQEMQRQFCQIDSTAEEILRRAFETLNLSARAHSRILRVSRTIADLDGSHDIQAQHIAEALQYRTLDRKYWT